jgi:hypothetical protein
MIDAGGYFARFPSSMTVRTRNRLITFSILAGPFVFFVCLLLFWDAEPLPPVLPLPHPNGYEDLVKAGHMLANDTGDFNETNAAQVRKMVSANAAAVALAREALSNQCRVPVQFSESFNSNHVGDLAPLKLLAWSFIAEGRLAEMENRPADAAKSYLDAIHLANESVRGGLLIDGLVGIAIEAIGMSHLQKLLPHLNANSSRDAATALETLDSQRQTWDEVMQQENSWSHASFRGWRYELMRWKDRKSMTAMFTKIRQKFYAQAQRTRQLTLDLAARAYELDKGHPPANLTDLVPDYLKAVPQDPFTGANMIYSP